VSAEITRLSAAELDSCAEDLATVLVDSVSGGSSLGFLAPFDQAAATAWWRGLVPAVADGGLVVFAARSDERVSGTVQLRLSGIPNGVHRAEVAKLMVARDARGHGVGRQLLAAAEQGAVAAGITLLILDTVTGSAAEQLYSSAGWTRVGTVPDYAADPGGALQPTTFFYKKVA
jgi:GNAT superfamily N-acetyltransferase